MSSPSKDPPAVTARPELLGRVLSERYRVDALIATGAFGAVYRGVHLHMRKQIAIKVLHPEIENFREMVHRFQREAIAGAHISHPNVAVASDLGKFDGDSYFLVQEYVRGETLRKVMREGPLPPARAARIARQAAAALDAVHWQGIVHRDLKPSNVMLVDGTEDFVKLIDFGFARVPREVPQMGEELDALEWTTEADDVFGHAAYLAPEAALGMRHVTEQYDLYALGVIFYEMLAGRHPFDVTQPAAKLFADHRSATPPRFDKLLNIPRELETVVRRLLEKDPSARFDAAQLMQALDEAMERDPVYRVCMTPESIRPPRALSTRPPPRARRRPNRRAPVLVLSVLVVAGLGALLLSLPTRGPRTEPAVESAANTRAADSAPAPSATPTSKDERKRQLIDIAPTGDTEKASAIVFELLRVDKKALAEEDVQNAVVTLLARLPANADATQNLFYTLAYDAGPPGLDIMYHVFERFPSSHAARRAESLLDLHVERGSPALHIAWAIRRSACGDIPQLFERAGAVGDERTLAILSPMRSPTCKPKPGQCCFPNDAALQSAIARIEKRR